MGGTRRKRKRFAGPGGAGEREADVQDLQSEKIVGTAVAKTPLVIVLTDPRAEDNPITYVNGAFQRTTLYSRDYAIGRNCRFLQGEETSDDDVERIREGLRGDKEFQVTITNYKADGTAFRNQLLISPVHNDDGELTAYFSVQREVRKSDGDNGIDPMDLLRELQHRVKNHLSMVVSMIRLQASREVTPASMRAVSRRIEALSVLYEELLGTSVDGKAPQKISAGAYLSRIASVVASLEGRSSVRVNIECDDAILSMEAAARVGLLLSELLTNALEHAFEGRDRGLVNVRFQGLTDGGARLTVEDDGIGLPEGSHWPEEAPSIPEQKERAEEADGPLDTTGNGRRAGVGGSIVAALTQSLAATLRVNSTPQGTIVTVDFRPEQ